MKVIIALLALTLLAGCGSLEKELGIANAQARAAASNAQAAKFAAIGKLGDGAGDTVRAVGIMSLADNVTAPQAQAVYQRNGWDIATGLLGIALQAYGIHANKDIAIAQSRNSRDVSLASYGAIADTAALIQAPGAVTTTTSTTTLGGDGVIGSGTWTGPATADNSNQGNSTAPPTVVMQPAPIIGSP